jgi:hypothetical protein
LALAASATARVCGDRKISKIECVSPPAADEELFRPAKQQPYVGRGGAGRGDARSHLGHLSSFGKIFSVVTEFGCDRDSDGLVGRSRPRCGHRLFWNISVCACPRFFFFARDPFPCSQLLARSTKAVRLGAFA